MATLKLHKESVEHIAFSADGSTLASASSDGTTVLWDMTALKKRAVLKHSYSVLAVTFSPDGKLVATAGTEMPKEAKPVGVVKLWDTATGRELAALQGELLTNPVFSVTFSPDGRTLAAGSPSPYRQRLRGCGADEGEAKLWEVATKKLRASFGMQLGFVYSLAFSPDGKTLAGGTGALAERKGEVVVWDVSTGKVKTRLKSDTAPVFAVAFSPDGKTLAAGGGALKDIFRGESENITELRLWDVATGKTVRLLKGHVDIVHSAAFSPDGKLLASAGGDQYEERGELKLWDIATGKERASLQGHKNLVTSVAFSPDGKVLASGSRDTTIKLWDVARAIEKKP